MATLSAVVLVVGCSTEPSTPIAPPAGIETTIEARVVATMEAKTAREASAQRTPATFQIESTPTPEPTSPRQFAPSSTVIPTEGTSPTPDVEAKVAAAPVADTATETAQRPATEVPPSESTATPVPPPVEIHSPTPVATPVGPSQTVFPGPTPTNLVGEEREATPMTGLLDYWPFGQTNSLAMGTIGQKRYGFLGVANGILVLDVADPAEPNFLGGFPSGFVGNPLHVQGNHLLVWAHTREPYLALYDVSLPLEPELLSTLPIAYVSDVTWHKGHLYIWGSGGSIVDWRDTSSPKWVGFSSEVTGPVAIFDEFLLVARGPEGLAVMDVSEPTQPELVGRLPACGATGTTDVAVTEDAVVVADNDCGLRMVDIADPANPKVIASQPGYGKSVSAQDNLVIAGSSHSTFGIIAAGPDSHFQPVGELSNKWGEVRDIEVEGEYAYIANGLSLEVVDISDPANSELKTRYWTF